MKRWLDSPKFLFGALRVVAVAAIAAGVWLSVVCGVLPTFAEEKGAAPVGVGYVVTSVINCGLWCIAWGAFFGMCGRLMQADTAFTQENSRTLHIIGASVSAIAGIMCLRALPRLIAVPDFFLVIEGVILPGAFLTVGMVAFILCRLLKSAMALEEEQVDVI